MITKKDVELYKNIIENATVTQAINTMIGLHTRICAIIRTGLEEEENEWVFYEFPSQIRDVWEDVLMNADYNDFDILDENDESFLIQLGTKLAISELVILGYTCNDAKDFLQYDSTLSIRLF